MTPETMLYRIVHPAQAQEDLFTSQVFRPSPTGSFVLSVFCGDRISPEEALQGFASRLSTDPGSYGVVGVTVAECLDLGLSVKTDESFAFGYAIIDFEGFTSNQMRRKSRALRESAMSRGWIVRPKR